MTGPINNIADWRVLLDGTDLSDRIRPRLISLTLSEKRGDEADQLDIVLSDADGMLAIPKEGAVLQVQLGWKQGRDVTAGLINKGSFKVDDVSHSGPPDQITIKARAADFTSEIRNRRAHSWKDTTLGAVLRDVAGRNGLTARIAPALASMALPAVTQSRESDIAFLRRLGRENDAVATVKDKHLIFAPKGAGQTSDGTALPRLTLHRRDGDGHRWQRQKRDGQEGVSASWHDKKAARRKTTTVGKADGAKKLRKVYPDEASAKRAATAESARLKRAPATLDLTLALGRADAYPEARVTTSGYKDVIDAATWLISEVSHRLDKAGGFTTDIKMETAPT
ncbi:contractile injection system protein, VgrG/Pvc8 family [Novosphingobium sp. P6W]|uniref:contractile injection system protein, VgrG/Pvc8 family n=1 Tax=Novosphingobium sp. P6W TaxID=1609758 RepID=UPI0005C2CEC0|nr:contractile injection system protein, VgrG/Pvc8 family [Novosphingobium sp. P6W]AXB75457.1 phage late control D family protein [Novosphingobium sp. P6W]KIS32516.1 phage late control protein [Novosphingobium sp. P6W]